MRGAPDATTRTTRVDCARTEREVVETAPVAKWTAARVTKWLAELHAAAAAAAVAAAAAAAPPPASGKAAGADDEDGALALAAALDLRVLKLPRGTDGKALVRLTVPRLALMCGSDRAIAQRAYEVGGVGRGGVAPLSTGVESPAVPQKRRATRSLHLASD